MVGAGGTLRVGMAGAGWVSRFHLPAWRKQAGRAEVVAIADPSGAALRTRRDVFAIPAAYASAEEMIERGELDIIDICAPREVHVPLTQLAESRGIAVLCQKPLAPSLGEAEALVRGLTGKGRVMVHENWRFRATYRRIREWLDSGVAGKIRRVQLDYMSSGMIPDASGTRPALVRQPNFPTIKRLVVMECLIHQLDALRFLLGELELVDAHLVRTNVDIIGEDVATLSLRRAADRVPVLVTGNLAARGEPPDARDHLRIFGEKATISLDGYRVSCAGETEITEEFDPAATYQGSYDSAIGHFLDCLESGAPFETEPVDNLRTLALVEAAYAQGPVHG